MPSHLLLALTALLFTTVLACQYNGGLAPAMLLGMHGSLLLAAACLGRGAWRVLPRSTAPLALGWQGAFMTATLLLGVALAFAAAASPLSALAAEQALVTGLLPAGYLLARACLKGGIDWDRLWSVFRLAATAMALLAVGERLLTGTRAYALLSDPNVLAGLFNVFILTQFAIVAMQLRRDERRGTDISLLLLFSAAQGATGSLSGLLCLLATLLPLAAFSAHGLSLRRALSLLGVAAVVMLLAMASSGGTKETPTSKLQAIAQHSSFTVRVAMAHSSLAIYHDSPWYGSGLGTYKMYYPRYRSTLDTGTTGDLAHNDYVQFLQEGGPLLLGSLLALALLVAARTARLMQQAWRGVGGSSGLAQVGAGFALLALLLHAGMNFIFYVAPLCLLFGVLLARLAPAPAGAEPTRGSGLAFGAVLLALATLLLATMGARALFLGLTRETCPLQACQVLGTDVPFVTKLTAYLAGTQPTWVPSREYLVANYLNTEQTISGDARKQEWRARAFKEAGALVEDIPQLWGYYITLAELIIRDPALAALLPQGLPAEPEKLYQLALMHYPFDLPTRLKLIQRLRDRGQQAEAYALLRQVMPFWYLWSNGDGGRMQLLHAGIPLAVELHRCQEANEMAQGLAVFVQLQRDAAAKGEPLPPPPNGLNPPTPEEGEKTLALAKDCH